MDRRRFLVRLGTASLSLPLVPQLGGQDPDHGAGHRPGPVTLFLAGDVMTGRGIDQILPHPGDPTLHESYLKDARRYVTLAESEHGEIPAPVPWDYVWGDALAELDAVGPAVRVINLETAITTSGDWWRTKGIHYRMHPRNTPVLEAAGVDACVLGNNHVLDWGHAGLVETLDALARHGMAGAGAGLDEAAARAPASLETGHGRILLFALGTPSAGVPSSWSAGADSPGVNVVRRLDDAGADRVIRDVEAARDAGDRVIVSIHWGGNWGYEVPAEQRSFAHRLIDSGAIDLVFGHSSHHPKGVEVYRGRLILYGAGDFLNDYEGIGGREEFRGDLPLMYFPELNADGGLRRLRMTPLRIRRFRLERAPAQDARWLADRLDREYRKLGCSVALREDDRLELGF